MNSLVLVNDKTVGSAGRNLGADRTLTIASGGLVIGNGNYLNTAFLGDETGFNAGTAGTVVFPKKAYVFVPVIPDNKNEHPEIRASIVSPEGAVFSYPGDLHLGGYYGSSEAADDMAAVASRAHPAFVDDAHFAGTGWIKVLVDECTQPTLLILR